MEDIIKEMQAHGATCADLKTTADELCALLKKTDEFNGLREVSINKCAGLSYFVCLNYEEKAGIDMIVKVTSKSAGSNFIVAALKEVKAETLEEPEYKHWRAEKGGIYFYTADCGDVRRTTDDRASEDGFRYAVGNYFQSSVEAQKYTNMQAAIQTIKDDAKGFEPDWDDQYQQKWAAYFNYNTEEFSAFYHCCDSGDQVYFKTRKDATDSLEKHEAEWKLLLGVEE